MDKIKKYMKKNYFNEKFSLEYSIYMIFLIECFVLTTVAAVFNTLAYEDFLFNALQWINVAFIVFVLLTTPKNRVKLKNLQILSITLFFIPLIFFHTGGYNGTAFLFATLSVYMLAVSYSGRMRVLVVTLVTTLYLGCIIIAYTNPELIRPIESELSRVQDICVSTAMTMVGIAVIATTVTRSFKRKNDELSEIVLKDALTGAYNRRYLYEELTAMINQKGKESLKGSILMMDIDHFKHINDSFGHSVGDEALIAFSNAVKQTLREGDVLVRYGGEEFVAILLNAGYTEAIKVAERVRVAVGEIEHQLGFKTTASIGVAVTKKDDTLDTVLIRADGYLYQAKENGRNRVVSHDDEKN